MLAFSKALLTCLAGCSFGMVSIVSHGQALIVWSAGPLDARPGHNSPAHIANHIELIDALPFDGIVVNEYFGRNLFNIALVHEQSASDGPGVITKPMVEKSFGAMVGKFKHLRHNFAKINLLMTSLPPTFADDIGWAKVNRNAKAYAEALEAIGFKGGMIDNESYFRPAGKTKKQLDYWLNSDHLAMIARGGEGIDSAQLLALARKRGKEFAQSFFSGFGKADLIVAHGPYVGCREAAQKIGTFGSDDYLMGAFFAGMVEGSPAGGQIIDGGELYDLRSENEFRMSREVRLAIGSHSTALIENPNRTHCPFMTPELDAVWRSKVGIAHGTFDRARKAVGREELYDDSDSAQFEATLRNAGKFSDKYVWHYTQWQDWLGPSPPPNQAKFDAAIRRARSHFRALQ